MFAKIYADINAIIVITNTILIIILITIVLIVAIIMSVSVLSTAHGRDFANSLCNLFANDTVGNAMRPNLSAMLSRFLCSVTLTLPPKRLWFIHNL